jgi:hypothetical protein
MLSAALRQVRGLAILSLMTLCLLLLMAAPAFADSSLAGMSQSQIIGCAGCGQSGGNDGCGEGNCGAQSQVQTPQLPMANPDSETPFEEQSGARKRPGNRFGPAEQVVQLRGEVVDVYQTSSKRGLRSGVYVLLQTNEDTLEVSLGPNWYLEEQQFSLEPDDWILVEGTRTRKGGTSSLMAYRVTRGEQVLMLRDENGMPLWRSGPTARKEAHPPVAPQA